MRKLVIIVVIVVVIVIVADRLALPHSSMSISTVGRSKQSCSSASIARYSSANFRWACFRCGWRRIT